jgi:hypothetical protein
LDVLEEIATGMYAREIVELTMTEEAEARGVLDAYVYLAGTRDDLERLPRIDAYDKALHDEVYVPKHRR